MRKYFLIFKTVSKCNKFRIKNKPRALCMIYRQWLSYVIYLNLLKIAQVLYIQMYCACCLVTELCPTLCVPMDCSPSHSSVCGISQARILEWVAISFSRGSSPPRDQIRVSCTGRWILHCWATREAHPLCPSAGIQNKTNFILLYFSFPPTWPLYWLLSSEQPDPNLVTWGVVKLLLVGK